MAAEFTQVLGIRFWNGSFSGLLDRVVQGGLLTAPSAPVLADLPADEAHREAVEGSDIAIADSGFMVILWLLMRGRKIPRISGLRFIRGLLTRPELREPGSTFWVMPTEEDSRLNRDWLNSRGIPVSEDSCWVAPLYGSGRLEDPALLALIEARRPRFVFLNLAGGVQERLGRFLQTRLSYKPAILCTGAAIAFDTGLQTHIPVWADRLILGLHIRTLANPRKYLPRYSKSLRIIPLLLRHGTRSVAVKG